MATGVVSSEMAVFLKANGIKHLKAAPYHLATNNLVERFMLIFKRAMNAGQQGGNQLAEFLLRYRVNPHIQSEVVKNQGIQKEYHGRHTKNSLTVFMPGQES